MRLISMEIENFRQYYGRQYIEFASDHRNTTVILGVNGEGKTGIYRAIMFVLFGSINISQDTKNEKIHLTNFKLLEESNKPVQSSVKLVFEHENKKYEIFRSLNAIKTSFEIVERQNKVELVEIDLHTGDFNPEILHDEDEIKLIINKIINEDIKDFFFFDAEKIDTLAKADNDARKEVRNAIFNLLQLDKVDMAIRQIKDLKRDITKILDNSTKDGTSSQLSSKLKNIEKEKSDLEKSILSQKDNLRNIEQLISEHELTLEKNKSIFNMKEKITGNKNNLIKLEEQQSNISQMLARNVFLDSPILLLENIFYENRSYFENFLGDKKISISEEVLSESLKHEKCIICDHELAERNKEYIKILLETQKHSASYELARDLLKDASVSIDNHQYYKNQLTTNIKSYRDVSVEIRKAESYIKDSEKDISNYAKNTSDLEEIQRMVETEKKNRDQILMKIGVDQKNLNNLIEEFEKIENQYQEILNREEKNNFNTDKFNLFIKLENDLKAISKEFSEEVRQLLGQTTTKLFKELIDKKDKDVVTEVEIDLHFQIVAKNEGGQVITEDISQGQRQILALSFITALAKLAAKEDSKDRIDYPLFMDSPFNRLSGVNRDNLIKNIPDLSSQWILLVTDTEWTSNEESVFKDTNRLGKSYRINQITKYHSEIEEVQLSENMATRGVM